MGDDGDDGGGDGRISQATHPGTTYPVKVSLTPMSNAALPRDRKKCLEQTLKLVDMFETCGELVGNGRKHMQNWLE